MPARCLQITDVKVDKRKETSKKRLLRDLAELEILQGSGELATIVAQPLENNLYEWHVNLLAPKGSRFHGIICHLRMHFPENYPQQPPRVECISSLTHSHVFGRWICLDMLEDSGYERHYGWSTGYTAQSILLQLQSFLLSDEQLHDYYHISQEQTDKDIKLSHSTTCNCSHDPKKGKAWPWNPLWAPYQDPSQPAKVEPVAAVPAPVAQSKPQDHSRIRKTQSSKLLTLSDDIFLHILQYIPVNLLASKVSKICTRFSRLSKHPYLRERRELVCFHTRAPFDEAQTVLGIGFSFKFHPVNKHVESTFTPLDLISWEAFNDLNVRKGLWNVPFKFFLPLYINAQHAKRSMPLFEKLLPKMYENIDLQGSSRHVVTLAVDLMSKLMNSMIVEVMKLNVHASLRALDGFLAFHRILIHFCKTYPALQDIIDDKIENFIRYESCRHKDEVRNLGEFLVLFLVSENYSWDDIKGALLQEVFERNALWITRAYPELIYVKEGESMSNRITKSFQATQVSNRLISFIYFFVEKVVGKGKANCPSLDDIAADYDSRFGRASEEMRLALQKAIQKDIVGISSFRQYLQYVNASSTSQHEIHKMLCDTMENAKRRGYVRRPPGEAAPRNQQRHFEPSRRSRGMSAGLSRLEPISFVLPTKNGNIRVTPGVTPGF